MSIKITTEDFIKKAKAVHGDRYNYSKTVYTSSKVKIIINCHIHGDFNQTTYTHLNGSGCPSCSGVKRLTTEDFIKKAKAVHGDKYSYSKTNFITSTKKVTITCPIHGDFLQLPSNHIHTSAGCKECTGTKQLTTEIFIKKARQIHGNKYNYNKSVYTKGTKKIIITCGIHGDFLQTAGNHINHSTKNGCPECGGSAKYTKDVFVAKAREKHGDKFDYSKVVYTNSQTKVVIICHKHGDFHQTPTRHISGDGCSKCRYDNPNKKRLTTEEFVEKAIKIHADKYDYSKSKYTLYKSSIIITCPVHGDFHQIAGAHLNGYGCQKCGSKTSHLENSISSFFKESFPELNVIERDKSLLSRCGEANMPLELDFYIPDFNLAIELHGNYWHSEAKLEYHKARTHIFEKYKLCKERGVQLLQFYEDEVDNKLEIVKNIISHKLGLSGDKMYARKLKVVKIDKTISKEFLNENHLQGSCNHKIAYGLVDKKEELLYAVMAFSYTVSNRGSVADPTKWELVRFASHGSIVGGASKLLSHFIKTHPECEELVSYSDNRISDGGLYNTLGFNIDESKSIVPDYTYILPNDKNKKRYTKTSLQKSRQKILFTKENGYIPFDPKETEYVNANRNGYYRLWDAGKIKWVLT